MTGELDPIAVAFLDEAESILDERGVSVRDLASYVDYLTSDALGAHAAESFAFDLLEALRHVALLRSLEELPASEWGALIDEHHRGQADRLRLYIEASRSKP